MRMKIAVCAVAMFALLGAKCNNCDQLLAAKVAACATGNTDLCKQANEAYDKGCAVQPTPTPVPTPTPEPTPTPTPQPIPSCKVILCGPGRHCVEGSGCVAGDPPVDTSVSAYTGGYIVKSKPYGNGLEATPTVQGDCAYCASVGLGTMGDGSLRCGCPLYGDGHPDRLAKELATMGGCPTWQYFTAKHGSSDAPIACTQRDGYDDGGGMSCDHFGDTVNRDDPNTEPFEGMPQVCGIQRDSAGLPTAGFFIIAHGDGYVRACDAVGEHCGQWVRVAY